MGRSFSRSAWFALFRRRINSYADLMKTVAYPAIPVTAETAARFAALTVEQKRVIRMRMAIEIGRLARRKSRAESATEFRAAAANIGNQARRKGLSLVKLKRMIGVSR